MVFGENRTWTKKTHVRGLDAGAEDIRDEEEDFEVIARPRDFEPVKKGFG
jgi:transcriptional/translational regulatory protein YebC/TACO1